MKYDQINGKKIHHNQYKNERFRMYSFRNFKKLHTLLN